MPLTSSPSWAEAELRRGCCVRGLPLYLRRYTSRGCPSYSTLFQPSSPCLLGVCKRLQWILKDVAEWKGFPAHEPKPLQAGCDQLRKNRAAATHTQRRPLTEHTTWRPLQACRRRRCIEAEALMCTAAAGGEAAIGTLVGDGAVLLQGGSGGGALVADCDVVPARDDNARFYEVLQRGHAPRPCFPGCGRPASPSPSPPSSPAACRARGVGPLKGRARDQLRTCQCLLTCSGRRTMQSAHVQDCGAHSLHTL